MRPVDHQYILLVRSDARGKRRAERRPLNLQIGIVTAPITRTGHLDLSSPTISDRAISDLIADLRHEQRRRAGTLHEIGGWEPGKPSREKSRASERQANEETD